MPTCSSRSCREPQEGGGFGTPAATNLNRSQQRIPRGGSAANAIAQGRCRDDYAALLAEGRGRADCQLPAAARRSERQGRRRWCQQQAEPRATAEGHCRRSLSGMRRHLGDSSLEREGAGGKRAPEVAQVARWSPSGARRRSIRNSAEGMVTASRIGRTVKQQMACGPAWDSRAGHRRGRRTATSRGPGWSWSSAAALGSPKRGHGSLEQRGGQQQLSRWHEVRRARAGGWWRSAASERGLRAVYRARQPSRRPAVVERSPSPPNPGATAGGTFCRRWLDRGAAQWCRSSRAACRSETSGMRVGRRSCSVRFVARMPWTYSSLPSGVPRMRRPWRSRGKDQSPVPRRGRASRRCAPVVEAVEVLLRSRLSSAQRIVCTGRCTKLEHQPGGLQAVKVRDALQTAVLAGGACSEDGTRQRRRGHEGYKHGGALAEVGDCRRFLPGCFPDASLAFVETDFSPVPQSDAEGIAQGTARILSGGATT